MPGTMTLARGGLLFAALVFGVIGFGMGVFLALCALPTWWVRPGLVALGLVAAGFGGGRLLGVLAEGTASPLMLIFAAIETASALFAFYLLRRLPG